jgi:hypothetical protein
LKITVKTRYIERWLLKIRYREIYYTHKERRWIKTTHNGGVERLLKVDSTQQTLAMKC